MHFQPLSHSLLGELYDLEEDAYRLALREVGRVGSPPAVSLQTVLAHASEALEELPGLARERSVRLSSARRLAFDTLRRVRDRLFDQIVDQEHGYRRTLTALHRGIDLVRVVQAAAIDEGDDGLARWCERWLSAREVLLAATSDELAWFGRHPSVARLPSVLLPLLFSPLAAPVDSHRLYPMAA